MEIHGTRRIGRTPHCPYRGDCAQAKGKVIKARASNNFADIVAENGREDFRSGKSYS